MIFKMPPDYSGQMLQQAIAQKLGIRHFSWQLEASSLDARNKRNIHWRLQLKVVSDEIAGTEAAAEESLVIPRSLRKAGILVVGSGPAGFFCAYALQKAGFSTTLIERGSEVIKRKRSVNSFERNGLFDPCNNYAFGEGGAGTFSDGKLTSRSKHISLERSFILSKYIEAGAPPEISHMAHPHLGTDKLVKIVGNLRQHYLEAGGKILFDTLLKDIVVKKGRVVEAVTTAGHLTADAFFLAPGHSAFETYRMLMRRGVAFRTKGFAIGSRMEHPQEVINLAQWGRPSLPGVKAAEYRLSSPANGKNRVYSFCMCPGGTVVPATAYAHTNIVNGMSYYNRGGRFANAACVAGIHPAELAGRDVGPAEALDLLEDLERAFYELAGGYAAPVCSIRDFTQALLRKTTFETSYPLGVVPAPLWEMLPPPVVSAMKAGLIEFARKMKGFDTGNLLGLESKTSSPVQVVREPSGRCAGFDNLYIVGEGSGYAGGIVSSAADGLRAALSFAGA